MHSNQDKPLDILEPMKYRALYYLISLLIIVPGISSLLTHGLNLSLDFTGGTNIVWNSPSLDEETIRNAFEFREVEIEEFSAQNDEITIRTSPIDSNAYNLILIELQDNYDISELRYETVGPSLGSELIRKTLYAVGIAAVLILIYVAFRFRNFQFGLTAIIAMLHDTLILLGTFSMLGRHYGVEIDTLFVTAVLTILSFSVHDTIVVYDRIRELKNKHSRLEFEEVVNRAVVETLGRSINNSMTIIFMLMAMYLIGGDSTRWFIFALLIGTISGTYSSTFTAAPLLVTWDKFFNKK